MGDGSDRVVVIANPATRVGRKPIEAAIVRHIPTGVDLDIRWTTLDTSARTIAMACRDHAGIVIAAGGDGTVSAVASALVGGQARLGMLPAGSTNIIARSMGIPRDVDGAANVIFGAYRLQPIDVGTCNRRTFLHMAGSGFDSHLFAAANRSLQRNVGWLAYIPAAVKALREQPATYEITTDQESFDVRAPLVLVANGASIVAPALTLSGDISTVDGWLDLLIVTATTPRELASVLARLAMRRFSDSPHVIHRKVKAMEVATDRPVPIELDGDVIEQTPATFGIRPAALSLIVPVA